MTIANLDATQLSMSGDKDAVRSRPMPAIDIRPAAYLLRSPILGQLLAAMLLIPCLPVIGVLVLLVRMTSTGPGLYRQVRVGQFGRIFVMYKIRSMVANAEDSTGPVWTQDHDDPRITLVGRFLRKSHLDELPQIINVVRGEMSLFGPRPERPELIPILEEQIPGYLNRLAVRPGITGLAQINLPPDSDVESVKSKLKLDLEYIRYATLFLEVRMFLWTCLRMAGVPASVATRVMRVGCNAVLAADARRKPRGPVTIEAIKSKGHTASSVSHRNGTPLNGASTGLAINGVPSSGHANGHVG